MKKLYLSVAALLISHIAIAQSSSIETYRDIARYYTDRLYAVGIVGTVYENGEFQDFTVGLKDIATNEAIDETTFIELGSATKAFTGTLLAREVVLGTISLDQKVSEFYPEFNGTSVGDITIRELATHTSGLDRMPDNLIEHNGDLDPYKNYSPELLFEYLKGVTITEKTYVYSNTAVALLGQILQKISQKSYTQMVREYIQEPLGLDGLELEWTDELEQRISRKYKSTLEPEPYWTELNSMNATGIIKINLRSLKKFLLAQLYPEQLESPLREAIPLSHQIQAEAEEFKMGLGWFEDTLNGVPYINHNGSTEGFTTEFIFDVNNKRGLIYTSNTDLFSPGLCMIQVFTGTECSAPVDAPEIDDSKYIGTYQAAGPEGPINIEIARNQQYGFLYVIVGSEIHQRLFNVDETTLKTDGDLVVFNFDSELNGTMTDNWEGTETYPFVRLEAPSAAE